MFDQSKIAALLDKRDPTRQAATGSELNAQNRLGSAARHRRDAVAVRARCAARPPDPALECAGRHRATPRS
ncbi:MAG: hypothetical protein MZV49_14235 [Rhodopseudomonas palustris]|nr:hypothetical protein [Rhodopseudomonas palustris]